MNRDSQPKASIEHKTLKKGNYSIHYFVSGNENTETIVFLHPAFGDHRCFDKQVDYFSPTFKVITLDMPGHGLTGISHSNEKLTDTPMHILEILQTENCEKVHIVGVSVGSLLAQSFALQYPEKTLSLTVLGGYDINREQKGIMKAQQKEILKWIFKMIFSMDAFRKHVATTAVINKTEQERFYESARLFTRKSFAMMSGLNKLIAERNIVKNYPLLLLSGEKDLPAAILANKEWHQHEPDCELHIIKNAGHCANMDNAKEFNEILMNFLTSRIERE